ncbi:MAG: chemoreceptor glutamine deamidase CheD [Pseudohongiellaceae bacterium]
MNFSHIKKFSTNDCHRVVARILPGEYYVTDQDEVITTVLGSCISACVHDSQRGVGGMNHFMLPSSDNKQSGWAGTDADTSNRYGNFAMESLINDLMKMGGDRSRFTVKIFGGGKILDAMTDVGSRNIDFVKSYLRAEGFRVDSEDVGDKYPRKINYYPSTGKVRVKKLRALYSDDIAKREKVFLSSIKKEEVGGEMELF